MTPFDLHVEPSPNMIFQCLTNKIFHLKRKTRIRVQENKHVPAGLPRAGVHLRGAAARRDHDPVAESGGELARRILAAAVDDDHLVATLAKRRERLQGGADAGGLVQRRDDDRESFSDQS